MGSDDIDDPCPDENTLVEFADGDLEAQAPRIRAHLDRCPSCRRAVSGLVAEISAPGGEPQPPAPTRLRPGDQVARYTIERFLGAGGMGVVYLAHDPELDRDVAIKLWRSTGDRAREELQARLRREARSMAQLAHPNVVGVYEVGAIESRLYLVMEFVRGQTLGAWLTEGAHPWHVKLDVLIQAGRGLAAAHAAGIIHRDFKPSNVLVGEDGRVRVVDFGLARAEGAPPTVEVGGTSKAADDSLTMTGAMVGTVAYMAPEQRRGEGPDARSDQYAFCVTIHEILTGERPSASGGSRSSANSPRGMGRVLSRGLSDDPDDRYPTVQDLLDDLAALRRGPRRRIYVASLVVAAGAGAGAVFSLTGSSPPDPASVPVPVPCTEGRGEVERAWDPARQAAVWAAFERVGSPVMRKRALAALDDVDGYATAWVAGYEDACRATRVRGDQSEAMLDRRMLCLRRARAELDALASSLLSIDDEGIGNVASAVASLPDLQRCRMPERLAQPAFDPLPPEHRDAIERAEKTLADARSLARLGDTTGSRDLLHEVEAQARALGRDGLLARALYSQGMGSFHRGKHANAEAQLVEAVQLAESVRDDETRAWAAVGLMSVIGVGLRRIPEGHQWRRVAEGAVSRLGPGADIVLRLRLLNQTGRLLSAEGKRDEALAAGREALALARAELDETDPRIASSLLQVAWGLPGDDPEALELMLQALAVAEQAFGVDHPKITFYLSGLAAVRYARDEYEESLQLFERCIALYELHFGAQYPDLGVALGNMGEVYMMMHRPREAITVLERADAILVAAYGEDDPGVASVRDTLVKARSAHDAADGTAADGAAAPKKR